MLAGALPLQQENKERRREMKFLMFAMCDEAKVAELAQIADKVAKTPGQKTIAQ